MGVILNQLTANNFCWWELVVYISFKMNLLKIRYETHDSEFLIIVKAFPTWQHYLEDFKHKVFLLTHYNNFCDFIDMKSLSSWQIFWA